MKCVPDNDGVSPIELCVIVSVLMLGMCCNLLLSIQCLYMYLMCICVLANTHTHTHKPNCMVTHNIVYPQNKYHDCAELILRQFPNELDCLVKLAGDKKVPEEQV